ncbi:hypothetical protein EW146_g7990 [Bondarzewia mesenterica]|uniref:FAD-binding FR-type domain-containing protein n=1 Tax=Bondarzewia mesenterica TaxID=1095465 RepID=A0A4S4LHU3_9AGAM|nr:hypothetical protein EW146_g7990 [Bondarzewia mesenterica]
MTMLLVSSSASTTPLTPNPTTPVLSDDLEWITAYLTIHRLSETSWRYAYILWIAFAFVTIIFGLLHCTGMRKGVFGAYWSRWSLRRRTWRKQHSLAMARKRGHPHKQPIPLPSNAQILSLAALTVAALAVTFVGPDYLAPSYKLWQFRRDLGVDRRATDLDPSNFLKYQPQYTIGKACWTSGGRAGLIAFALFPLCVLFALKAPPFALFAVPFFVNLHFDKLTWLHRWLGRLIWFISAIHVVLWSVQLAKDRRVGTGQVAYIYAWQYPKFIYAWTAFGLFTLLVILSLRPIRDRHYEAFYFLHILLVPLTIIMSALHHPPVWWWCWAALALWIGERTWRATKWLYTNGYVGSHVSSSQVPGRQKDWKRKQEWEMRPMNSNVRGGRGKQRTSAPPVSPRSNHHSGAPSASSEQFLLPSTISTSIYVPPPGYAQAELLSGRTIRVRLVTPGYLTWAPGQNFLLCIPSVSKFLSHPFTCASVCDEQTATNEGRMIVFLIRAKNGWTKDLWDSVVALIASGRKHPRNESPLDHTFPPMGVLMRSWVDGPFGSSTRTNWNAFASVLIVAGGSGVSFCLSVLEYLCLCIAGRDGRFLGGVSGWGKSSTRTRRVRFVWIVREFSHIQWCASALRRCKALVPQNALQIDVFVTNFQPSSGRFPFSPYTPITPSTAATDVNVFAPPVPRFVKEAIHAAGRSRDSDGEDPHESSDDTVDSYVDLSYYTGGFVGDSEERVGELGHEEDVLDLTNFDGDNDERIPGELSMNNTVKREGRKRRATSRYSRMGRGMGKSAFSFDEHAAAGTSGTLSSPTSPPTKYVSLQNPSNRASAKLEGHSRNESNDSWRLFHEVDLGNPSDVPSGGRTPLSVAIPSSRHSQVPFRPQTHHSRPTSYLHPDTSKPDVDVRRDFALSPVTPKTAEWDSRSIASDLNSVHALMPQVGAGASGEQLQLQLDEGEMQDISVMAEFAMPGRPKLDMILQDEVGNASGTVAVACCGPTTLNAVMRKLVAAQIDPARIRRGDMSGSISFVSEEFAY